MTQGQLKICGTARHHTCIYKSLVGALVSVKSFLPFNTHSNSVLKILLHNILLSLVIFLNLYSKRNVFAIALLSEIKHWFLPCFQQDPVSSSAVFTSLLACKDSILKGLIFTSNFHSVYITSCQKRHFLYVLVFIWGLVPVQSQILLNLQLVPSTVGGYPILWAAMYKVSIILTSWYIRELNLLARIFFILLYVL